MSHDHHTPRFEDGVQSAETSERRPEQVSTDGPESTSGTGSPEVTRRAALTAAVGTTLGVSGCLGFGPDSGDGTPASGTPTATATDSTSSAIEVRLESAPDGLQKFAFSVSHDSVELTSVDAGVIDGEEFQIVEGGSGSQQVRVRGADLSQSVQGSSEPVSLFTLTFAEAVDPSNLSVAADVLVADNGDSLTDQWTVRTTTPPE